MTKRKKNKKKKSVNSDDFSPEMMEWILQGIDGNPNTTATPSAELAEEINQVFVRKFKKDPMWKNMIEDFGKEKAEEMLKQIRIKGNDE